MSCWVRALRLAVILAGVGVAGVAASSDMPQEYNAVTITKNLNVLLPDFFTYSTDTIPASANGCPITSATWYIHMNTVGTDGVLWSSDYKPWSVFEAAAVQPGNFGQFSILENSLTKKVFRQPKAWESMGITSSIYYDHAKVEAVYTCAKASPPPTPPEPTCEKIWWCQDDDGDGYGNCDYPAHECTKPAGFAECPGVADGGYCDCEEGNPNVQDTALYYIDADGDGYVLSGSKAWLCPKQVTAKHVAMTKEQAQQKIDCDDNAKWITTVNVCTDTDGDGWWVGPCICGTTGSKQVALTAENQTKQDCNDKDKGGTTPQTFYWDGDGDGYPVKDGAHKECAAVLYNANGKWITVKQAAIQSWVTDDVEKPVPVYEPTECDNDPNGHEPKDYYLDDDGDGAPFPQNGAINDPPVVPYLGPVGSAVTPGSVITPPTVTPGSVVAPPTARPGAGATPAVASGRNGSPRARPTSATPAAKNGKYETKKFCSDAKAKQAKFVPAPANAGDWDRCDANPKLLKPKHYCLDKDADGFGGKGGMHCTAEPPNAGYVNSTKGADCTDCDDTNDGVGDFFQIFRDADNDGFGDIRLSKKVQCSSYDLSTKQISAYKTGGPQSGKGWALDPNDLSDIIDADHDMVKNLTKTPQRYFLVEQDNGELQFCRHSDGVGVGQVACYAADTIPILRGFCERSLEALPIIRVSDLTAIAVGTATFDQHVQLTTNCLSFGVLKSLGRRALIIQSPQIKIVFTDFDPMGRQLLPLVGAPFADLGFLIDPPPGLDSIAIEDSLMQRLLPYVVADIPTAIRGPIPVRFAGDNAARSILLDGGLGPTFKNTVAPIEGDFPPIPDLLIHPWIVLKEAAVTKFTQFADTDMDYLPDAVELLFHLDPQSKDTDGDGYEDGLEYMWAHHTPDLAHVPTQLPDMWEWQHIPAVLSPTEQSDLAMAKVNALVLVPSMIDRLAELYEDDPDVALELDPGLLQLLIQDARAVYSLEISNPSYLLYPFFPTRRFAYGIAGGCGEDHNSVCVNVDLFYKNMSFQKSFNGLPVTTKITTTLLHEALHHAIAMNIPDSSGVLEHEVIADVLGDGDVGFCLTYKGAP